MLSPAAKSQFTVELYSNVVLEMLGGKKKSPAVTQEFVIQSHLSFEGKGKKTKNSLTALCACERVLVFVFCFSSSSL